MVLLIEQYAELKEELLQCHCNPAWTKSGRLILWNVTAICEMSPVRWENTLGTAILENCSKDQSFRFVLWSNIIRSLRKTSQDSINVVKKLYGHPLSPSPR